MGAAATSSVKSFQSLIVLEGSGGERKFPVVSTARGHCMGLRGNGKDGLFCHWNSRRPVNYHTHNFQLTYLILLLHTTSRLSQCQKCPSFPFVWCQWLKSHGGTVKSSPGTALGTKLWRSAMELVRSDSRLPGSHRTEDLARPYT